jgi:cobalt-zinc-cadmium efflux system membrane fusion protein
VVAKHATVGELLGVETSAFTVADLDSVWVVFNVYQKDLALVKTGQKVSIEIRPGSYREGMVSYVSPLIDEQTRTVQARVVLNNSDGALQPGLFVTVRVAGSINKAPIVVPLSAIQTLEEKEVIFIEDGDGFKAVPVELGKENGELAIVVSGLRTGQRYVVRGAFELKSQIVASGMGAHAGHGH